jgi:polysaccharide pyruvyl transferase WcaK-like protein
MNAVHELRVNRGTPGRARRPQSGAAATAPYRKPGIAVFGLFGCGNLGNDGSLEAMLLFLREKRPDARLFCICKVPEVVADTFEINTIPIRSARADGIGRVVDRIFLKIPCKILDIIHALRYIRKAGIMIVPGTGILDDFGERPTGMPFDVFNWCLAARLMGTRIAFVSIGVGPIQNRLSRWLMTSAARMADYRSYRDTASRTFMESVGFDTSRDAMYPDLAFQLPVPQSADAEPSRQLTVGVGVMDYRGWYAFDGRGQEIFDSYVAKMAMFITHLLSKGYNVRLLTGDEGDVPAMEAVLAALGEADTQRLSSEPVHSLHDVFNQVARTDLVVATRFHNVVAALMAGKPVISLGYAAKNDLLLGEMGLGEYCQRIDSFDVGVLVEQFSRLAENREEYSRTIGCRVGEFRKSLELQDEYLLSTVL